MLTVKPTIHQVKPTVSWHQRYISGSYTGTKGNTGFPPITYGQALSGAAIGISIIDLIANVFTSKTGGGSFVRKFVVPAFCTTLGFIGFSASKPPNNVFENELVNNGILNIVDKLFKGINSNGSFSRVLNNSFGENVTQAVNLLLTTISRKVSALASEYSDGNKALDAMAKMTQNPDDFTLDRLSSFISKLTPERFYLLLSEQNDFVKNLLRTAFNNENSGIRTGIRGLVRVINNELLIPNGLEMDLGYDPRNNLLRINLFTTDIFTDGSSHYKPCVSVLCEPKDFYASLHALKKSLDEVKESKTESAQILNKQILNAFASAFDKCLRTGKIEGGYCSLNITACGTMSGVVRSKHIESIITSPVRNAINSLLQHITLPKSTRPAKSQTEVLTGEAGEPPFEDLHNVVSSPLSSNQTLQEVQNLDELLTRLGFKDIKWDETDDRTKKLTKLKLAYIVSYFLHRTFIEKVPVAKSVTNTVCDDLRKCLGNDVIDREYLPLFGQISQNNLPWYYLDLDLTLEALDIKAGFPEKASDVEKVRRLIAYLPEHQRLRIEEDLDRRCSLTEAESLG